MNIRAFKKRERRSMRKLIKLGAREPHEFSIADGSEAIHAPADLPRRHQDPHGFVKDGSLRGVPVVWETTGYYEPETYCHLPSVLLAQRISEDEMCYDKIVTEYEEGPAWGTMEYLDLEFPPAVAKEPK